MTRAKILIPLMLCWTLALGQLQCRDDNGNPVDWYVMYKLPMMTKQSNFLLRRGLEYLYITSEDPSANWKLSLRSMNDSRSMAGLTLQPLYDGRSQNLVHILYNDDPPNATAGAGYGHTKGVVMSDGKTGFWLVHSTPKFPLEPFDSSSHPNRYQYPGTALRYGQSFLCISLPASQMDALGTQLMYNKPKIYSVNLPSEMKNIFPNLTLAASKKFVKTPPWYHKAKLTSIHGTAFTSYAKAGRFNKELYSDWLAADLLADLNVETWANGAGELPSSCTNKFQVLDVKLVALRFNQSEKIIQFKNSQDHSKWAVTANNGTTVCIGDINRMAAQLKRGGGTVCFDQPDVWKKYSKSVVDVEPCPLN